VIDKNLRFIFEPSESTCMHNAITIALKLATIRGRRLLMPATLALL
jgi:hypothetical protein